MTHIARVSYMIEMKQSDACNHRGLGLVSMWWRQDIIRSEVEWGLEIGEGKGKIWREGWGKKARQVGGGDACEGSNVAY